MMKCDFDKQGCTAPIPVKCSDDCIIKELKAEIAALEKNIKECEKEYTALSKQYKYLEKNYYFILERYEKLQEETSLTN